MAKVKLTQQYIDKPPPVPAGSIKAEHCDTALPGLLWEQRAVNTEWGSYRLRYKNSTGKTSYAAIGRSCDISLADARQKAKQLKAEIQLGADPQASARERRKSQTWNTFFTDYYLPHVKQHKRSWSNDAEMQRLRISRQFGDIQINKFTRREVQQWLNDLRESGLAPATCDHHAKLIRQALNLAVQWDLLDSNPVGGIKLFGGDNRIENVLTNDQLQTLMATLDKPTDRRKTASQVIKFLLFTGARVNEALNANWSDIDHANRTWTVQATNSKSKQRRSIPLNDAAMAVLKKLPTKGKSEWLFISRQGDGTQRMTTISKVWQEIRKDAGLPWLRLHDLRHNYASMLVNSGRTLYEVQQILGHSDSKVTERYAHLSTKTLQDAANSASTYLDKAMEKTGKKKHQ
jgi:integrase